jgi:hypothetical protein
MPMRGTLPMRDGRDHNFSLARYPDFFVVCSLAGIGLAATLVIAVVFPASTDLTTLFTQLGGYG